jgi:DNA polymerase-3 subunit delta
MGAPLRELERALAAETWPPVVLLSGEDAEARGRCVERILATLSEEDRSVGVDRFVASPLPPALDAARTRALFGGRRIVVAIEPEGFSGTVRDERAEVQLKSFVTQPPPHALLVLVAERIDRRRGVVKTIEKHGLHLECPLPRERDMPRWIAQAAHERGLELHPAAVQALADAVGTDTAQAARELDKLGLLVHEGDGRRATIDPETVVAALGPHRAVGAFALEDALLEGRTAAALEALERHLDASRGEGLPLLGRLSGIARRLAVAHAVVAAGGGEQTVREALGCHPFVAKKYTRAARGVGARADRALAACVAADRMLKSGGDARGALGGVLLALTGAL